MTKKQIIELYQSLYKLGNLKGVKFCYAVSKNISMIESEIKTLEKVLEPSEDYQKFDKERIELAKKYSKKQENGEPVVEIKNGLQQFVLENKEEFEKEIEALREKHKEAIDKKEEQIKEYNKLLEEETPMVFHKVLIADVPADITSEQFNSIKEVIAE